MSFAPLSMLLLATTCRGDDGKDRSPRVEVMQPGVKFTLVAEQPELVTPTGLDVDDQGRVWLIASHTHHRPSEYEGPEFDEILIFEPDGTRRQFYNRTSQTMDLELGEDGWVYLAERSRIVRIKDTDGDGKADVEEQPFTLTTDAVYPHNGLSGLAWHPSGDLVFGLGENHSESWSLSGPDGAIIHGLGEGGVFRCRGDLTGLRQVARGLWNPFGICSLSNGELFCVDNDPGERPPCRLLHIVDHSDYGYRRIYGGAAHHPFVGWLGELRGTLPMIRPSGEAPCGISPFGQGAIVPSWSEHRIQYFPLQRQGASYQAGAVELLRGGRYFRPTCIAAVPTTSDASTRTWYLTDWVDGRYEVHGYGRLWKLEIDLRKADWLGPMELEPPTQQAVLADGMRSDGVRISRDELLRLAEDADAFVAQAAIVALSRQAFQWRPSDIESLPAGQRATAAVALRIAAHQSYRFAEMPLPHQPWVALLLNDSDPAVRFEALRWISDARLAEYLPAIEKLQKESSLTFEVFEAAIATWNTLSGRPQEGTHNPELLLQRVADADSPPRLRAYALRMLPIAPTVAPKQPQIVGTRFPAGLTIELLNELVAVGDAELSFEAVQVLSGNPIVGAELLKRIAMDSSQPLTLRSEAIAGLTAVAAEHLEFLMTMTIDSHDQALREEALRAMRRTAFSQDQIALLKQSKREHPESADLFDALIIPDAINTNRPDATDIDRWLAMLDSIESAPDVETGRRVFQNTRIASCSNCHRHNGRGNVVGPDLSNVHAQSNRRQLLESILLPSRDMAPEYQPSAILLNDGRIVVGIRLRSWVKETIRDANGRNETFDRDEVESIVPLQKSFMPDGLANALTNRELRDLLAFLQNAGSQDANAGNLAAPR
ncbi:MAG: c-type cytochrome [Pirellulaceae bacterium]